MNRLLALAIAATMVGCKSMPFSPFTAPRVTGRVLDAETRTPLAGVKVFSGKQATGLRAGMPPKGGELLLAKAPERTDAQGRFVLETERVLTPFRRDGWYAVQLRFEHAGYARLFTNYSRLNLSTNTLRDDNVLTTGDILLQPLTPQ